MEKDREPNQALRAAREARGWSVRELSRRSNVSNATISRIETGHNIPRRKNRLRIAAALDLEHNELFDEDSDVIREFAKLLKAEGDRGGRAQIITRALAIAGPPHN
jgi:transcriptional regulator with XRE-family HTH domain